MDKYEMGDFVSLDQQVVKTPSQLQTGFGQESHTNMFHDRLIFWDAASKYINVSNLVSLSAGETTKLSRNGFGKLHDLR